MRSDLVFRANAKVQNRFQLCRLTSTSARTMTCSSASMQTTINDALKAISGHSAPIVAQLPHTDELKASDLLNGPAFILDPVI